MFSCQQPVTEWLRRIGGREGQLDGGRHAMMLQQLAVSVKLTKHAPGGIHERAFTLSASLHKNTANRSHARL
jgi:hypothetical protein